MTTIRFKKSRLRFYLIMIVIWGIFLILNIFIGPHDNWVFYIWIILPLSYISMYSWDYFKQYLTIENGFIYQNSLFPKKLELKKIKNLKKFAGDYILETDGKKLRIDTSIIDPDSLKQLDKELSDFQNPLSQ